MPPCADDRADGGNCRTWLRPVGMVPLADPEISQGGASQGFSPQGGPSQGMALQGVTPLAGGPMGFTHLDVINDRGGELTVCRIANDQLMDNAAAGGADAEARAQQLFDRITRRREDFAGLSLDAPRIMGILNTTPDSFSDGGDNAAADAALRSAQQMIADGADILDIGGESTRPGADPVGFDEECRRILPVITPLAEAGHVVSADTRHTNVMATALDAGAAIINDVGGLRDDGAVQLVAERAAPSIIMHMQGEPGTMQDNPCYHYAPTDIYDWLEQRIAVAQAAGLSRADLAVDPGFGFGKTPRHNMEIMATITLLHGLGVPIVLGVSRKSTIAHFSKGEAAKDRVAGSVALAALALPQGVQVFRVHDVAETAQALGNTRAFAAAAL
ncbi:MAG: dihydropteroate synthase [Alphaproteobacteria bacterium]|nr:dihydropteroate synthase [Alphaproteobacteria bacterium]